MSLNVGDTIVSGQNRWQVVGTFEAGGGVAETEIWCDARVLQGAYQRGNSYQSVLARLDSADSLDDVSRLADVESAAERVRSGARTSYYAGQSQAMTGLIQAIGFGIAGADGHRRHLRRHSHDVYGGRRRAREIATLRALGFSTSAVLDLGARRVDRARRHRRIDWRARLRTSRSTAIRRRR